MNTTIMAHIGHKLVVEVVDSDKLVILCQMCDLYLTNLNNPEVIFSLGVSRMRADFLPMKIKVK